MTNQTRSTTRKTLITVVGAIMENETHELFCALRSPSMSMPNLWEFPGGKVEAGESPFQAIRRELWEEFACTVEPVHEPEPEIFCDTTHEYEAFIVRLLTIRCRLVGGDLVAAEHASVRWVDKKDLLSLEWAPADLPAVRKLMGADPRPGTATVRH